MTPKIKELQETKLIGKKVSMSFTENKTGELWRDFIPKRREIKNNINTSLYSVEVYSDAGFFEKFDPNKIFEKWAAVEVSDHITIPFEMEKLIIPGGLYAVFPYRGKGSGASEAYKFIYGTWIPGSVYTLDNRPHFALMGAKYRTEHPDSEEELWIPVRNKDVAV
ncbi:AraC family transcriptional regulator [Sinomicrobium oceani]|uniref:AraC family transcriptional regulator n=1 Tax=Sinomicrobium oceani TaxID=1150368 RepID=A0A1K1M229_9FLAO|nr:GyrI-like domain-containing protein [Sinomicrobium oceani]SFW17202.1 AraC family transcriptional regulator [Sinomicrobium oceani]